MTNLVIIKSDKIQYYTYGTDYYFCLKWQQVEVFKFIFYLGIIYTIFGLLWGIVTFLYRAIRENQSEVETILLQAGGFYFLASLTAINVLNPFNVVERNTSSYAYMILGGVVLYLYLMSKLQKNKRMITMFNGRVKMPNEDKNMKIEGTLIGLTLALYVVTLIYPEIAMHAANEWIYTKVQELYGTFLLNFIFGVIGFFFLLQILFQGMIASAKAINALTGRKGSVHDHGMGNGPTGQNEFDDYEIVEDEPKTNDDDQQNLLNS